jgi:hypothetical protein
MALVLSAMVGAAVLAVLLLKGDVERRPPSHAPVSAGDPPVTVPESARRALPTSPYHSDEHSGAAPLAAESRERASYVAPVPTSLLSGAVVDARGAFVGGLPLHWRDARGALRGRGTTDAFGAFVLTDLPAGEVGQLLLGNPTSPVGREPSARLEPGRAELGTIEVPRLGELTLLVVDEEGRPVPEAVLSGVGNRGGFLEGRSDEEGLARHAHLPRGMYRAFAAHPTYGRGNTVFEYDPEHATPVQVVLRRDTAH